MKLITAKYVPGCRTHIKSVFQDFYTVEYIHAGLMYFAVDGGVRHLLDRPALFWHLPGRVYEYGPADEAGWDHHYVLLRGARGKRLVGDGFDRLSGDGFVFVVRPQEVRDIFLRLVEILPARTPAIQAEGVILLERLLRLAAFTRAESESVYDRKIRLLADRIRDNPFAEYQTEVLAAGLHVCEGHFRRLFRKYIGRSFYDYLLYCRMTRAAEWLENPDIPVKMVAARAGMADVAQFSKLFKKQIGLSPRQYQSAVLFGSAAAGQGSFIGHGVARVFQ